MPFNSLNFLYFFLGFYFIYLVLQKSHCYQNLWLLAASYVFYLFWDWRFLFVLLAITSISYIIGLRLGSHSDDEWLKPKIHRLLLGIGLLFNLGILVFFKYANYFTTGLVDIFDRFNLPLDPLLVDIILPVGLSFYSLQACSYLLDVSARRILPSDNILEFALFVAFFPQLLAGPIERAGRMLPQFHQVRKVTPPMVSAGIYLLFSGFFKKIVIADNLGVITTNIFDHYTTSSGIDMLLAILAFTVQLYADFSAYTDIARGLARLMGIELMVNFRLPYFSSTPADFWSRWHISLSEWLRDYIFYPIRRALLGWKNPASKLVGLLLPPLVTMLVSGLWHGTGLNFILWGLYYGILMILFQVLDKRRPAKLLKHTPVEQRAIYLRVVRWISFWLGGGARVLFMFVLISFGWFIFRVESLDQFVYILTHLSLEPSAESASLWANIVLFSFPLIVAQILQQAWGDLLILNRVPSILRITLFATALVLIIVLGVRQASEFIYVQF